MELELDQLLLNLEACYDARKWASSKETWEQAWYSCPRGDWMLWAEEQGLWSFTPEERKAFEAELRPINKAREAQYRSLKETYEAQMRPIYESFEDELRLVDEAHWPRVADLIRLIVRRPVGCTSAKARSLKTEIGISKSWWLEIS